MSRLLENLRIRNQKRLREVQVRNKSRIEKRKYYGVGSQIEDYQKLIVENLYDEDLLKNILSEDLSEGITESFEQYLNVLNERLFKIREQLNQYFDKSFEKGSRRVQNKNGEVKFGEVKDISALEAIKQNQFKYLQNITDDQRKIVRRELTTGLDKGLSTQEIAGNLQNGIKDMTKARANTIARSELVKSHNIGQVETMKELGAEEYIYWTANDKKVAKICKKLQGPKSKPHKYDVSKAGDDMNPLPVTHSHPNCRCTILID